MPSTDSKNDHDILIELKTLMNMVLDELKGQKMSYAALQAKVENIEKTSIQDNVVQRLVTVEVGVQKNTQWIQGRKAIDGFVYILLTAGILSVAAILGLIFKII